MGTEEIHQKLIQEVDAVNCIFCCKQIQDPGKPKRYFCCSNMKWIKDGYLVCKNCGQVYDNLTANKFVDLSENRHRIRKKSVYHRKYHILNVINDIAQKNRMQIGYYNRQKILRIFALIDEATKQVDANRKRMVCIKFILKQLFDILGIEYKFFPLTRSRKTLKYYEDWWERVYALIKDDINRPALF